MLKKQNSHHLQTVALHKSPSIIRTLKAVAMAAAFAFHKNYLPLQNIQLKQKHDY